MYPPCGGEGEVAQGFVDIAQQVAIAVGTISIRVAIGIIARGTVVGIIVVVRNVIRIIRVTVVTRNVVGVGGGVIIARVIVVKTKIVVGGIIVGAPPLEPLREFSEPFRGARLEFWIAGRINL